MSPRALIACALVLAATPARAEGWDAAPGFGGTFQTIGDDGYAGTVLHVHVKRRVVSRIGVSGTAELAAVSNDDIDGGIVRGLAGVDFTVVESTRGLRIGLVASLGAGTETIAWDRGTLTRGTSYLALEYVSSFRIERSGFVRNLDALGFRFGVRGQLSPGVAGATIARLCSACTSQDAPDPGIDAGVAIYMGLLFGR